MILRNKTEGYQQVTLKDESVILVNPYRTVTVPEGTYYDREVFFCETPIVREVVERKSKKQIKTKGEL